MSQEVRMITAMAKAKDGRTLLLIGLSADNLQHLISERPCYLDLSHVRLTAGDTVGHIAVFYAKDDATLFETLDSLIGPTTEVVNHVPGPGRAQ